MEILKDYVGINGIWAILATIIFFVLTPFIRKLQRQLQEEKGKKAEVEQQPVKVEQ